MLKDLGVKVEGRDLLVIEDIVDSGITLSYLTNLLKTRGRGKRGNMHAA